MNTSPADRYDYLPPRPDWAVFAFEGFVGHWSDVLPAAAPFLRWAWLPIVREELPAARVQYLSESHRGLRQAWSAVRAMARSGPLPPIIVLGYSNGGHAALEFAEELNRWRVPIALGFTGDPVRKRLEFLLPHPPPFERPSNAARWINIYQRTDRIALLGLAPLRGHPVEGADENERLDDLGELGHLLLPGDPRVKDRLRRELRALQAGRS